MSWIKLDLNTQNIEASTDKAILVVIPKPVCNRLGVSEKMKFWHPSKLIRDNGGKGYFKTLSLTEDFEIKAFKNGNGKYNKFEKIDEIVISGKDLIDSWTE